MQKQLLAHLKRYRTGAINAVSSKELEVKAHVTFAKVTEQTASAVRLTGGTMFPRVPPPAYSVDGYEDTTFVPCSLGELGDSIRGTGPPYEAHREQSELCYFRRNSVRLGEVMKNQ